MRLVSVEQEKLERFLRLSHRFKIDGLLPEIQSQSDPKAHNLSSDDIKIEHEEENTAPAFTKSENMKTFPDTNSSKTSSNDEELELRIFDHITKKTDGLLYCDFCGKTSKTKQVIRNHVEIHLDLNYACDACTKTFKTRNNLNVHKSKDHKKI